MAFLSLLPAIGAAFVWLPVAIWLFVTGAIWQSMALAAWGTLVIGLLDNLLRPMLVGKATLMPDYVVMIRTLSGMVVFGINGFVLAPVIAAMFFAVWHLYLTTRQDATTPSDLSEPKTATQSTCAGWTRHSVALQCGSAGSRTKRIGRGRR